VPHPVAPPAPVAIAAAGDQVSLAQVTALDAGVLSSLVRRHGQLARGGGRLRVVNAAPEVARMLRDLGLAWMLEGRPLPALEPANEPMQLRGA
jgi:anti-anti-sigma regulatory factor